MSAKELERLHCMQVLVERRTTQRLVAEQLGMSVRQVQRLRDAFVERGPAGLVSGRRGKRSDRSHSDAFRDQALDIVRSRYAGFGPTLAHEKLLEQHGFGPSLETLRGWMAGWLPPASGKRARSADDGRSHRVRGVHVSASSNR